MEILRSFEYGGKSLSVANARGVSHPSCPQDEQRPPEHCPGAYKPHTQTVGTEHFAQLIYEILWLGNFMAEFRALHHPRITNQCTSLLSYK